MFWIWLIITVQVMFYWRWGVSRVLGVSFLWRVVKFLQPFCYANSTVWFLAMKIVLLYMIMQLSFNFARPWGYWGMVDLLKSKFWKKLWWMLVEAVISSGACSHLFELLVNGFWMEYWRLWCYGLLNLPSSAWNVYVQVDWQHFCFEMWSPLVPFWTRVAS